MGLSGEIMSWWVQKLDGVSIETLKFSTTDRTSVTTIKNLVNYGQHMEIVTIEQPKYQGGFDDVIQLDDVVTDKYLLFWV